MPTQLTPADFSTTAFHQLSTEMTRACGVHIVCTLISSAPGDYDLVQIACPKGTFREPVFSSPIAAARVCYRRVRQALNLPVND